MTELRVTVPDDIAERLASEAAERGTTTEDLAADVLRQHAPATRSRSLSFIGIADALPGAPSAAEAERMLEDGEDNGYPP
jgi:hypothetical protein